MGLQGERVKNVKCPNSSSRPNSQLFLHHFSTPNQTRPTTMIRKRKKKEKKIKAQPLSFLSLPDEIAENILARISKWYYPNLSLVCKRFLSLISTHDLYKTRSLIGTTEPCLYFCLEDSPNIPSPKWFTLWIKPGDDQTLTNDDETRHNFSLVPVPSCPYPHHAPDSSTVPVGSEIYLIGGPNNRPPSSRVSILDCRSHTWRDGPSMSVARAGASAFLTNGKLYVIERCRKDNNWMEVLDIKTQTWSPLLSHGATEFRNELFEIREFRGKIYAIANKNYVYNPNEDTWEVVEIYIDPAWCVIKNNMFSCNSSGYLVWYHYSRGKWIGVKGSDMELLRVHRPYDLEGGRVLKISCYGGKLLVMWVSKFKEYNGKPERRIWCAKIALEKCYGNEIWGNIEWVHDLLTVTSSFKFLSCVVSWI